MAQGPMASFSSKLEKGSASAIGKITFFTALFIFSFCAIPTVKVTRYFGLKGRSCIVKINFQHTKL
jgi:hypothetical protein